MSHVEPLQLRTLASVAYEIVKARDLAELREIGNWIGGELEPNERTKKFLRACYECREEELKLCQP